MRLDSLSAFFKSLGIVNLIASWRVWKIPSTMTQGSFSAIISNSPQETREKRKIRSLDVTKGIRSLYSPPLNDRKSPTLLKWPIYIFVDGRLNNRSVEVLFLFVFLANVTHSVLQEVTSAAAGAWCRNKQTRDIKGSSFSFIRKHVS